MGHFIGFSYPHSDKVRASRRMSNVSISQTDLIFLILICYLLSLQEYCDHVMTLWTDEGIRACYDRSNEFPLLDSAK